MLRIVPTAYPREVATSVEQEIAEIKDAVAPSANQGQLRRRHIDGQDIRGETVVLLTNAIIAWSITYIEPATQHLTAAGTPIPTNPATLWERVSGRNAVPNPSTIEATVAALVAEVTPDPTRSDQ